LRLVFRWNPRVGTRFTDEFKLLLKDTMYDGCKVLASYFGNLLGQ